MHTFITKTDTINRDFGGGATAAKFAKQVVGYDAVVVVRDGQTFWMLPRDAETFGGEVMNTAAAILAGDKVQRNATQASHNAWALDKAGPAARRVRHAKFGAGTVLAEDAKTVTVLFDGAKKQMRMLASVLETIV